MRSFETKSAIVKKTVHINGRKSGVSLEDAFWNALKEIAAANKITVSDFISTINDQERHTNLSSALRLFVLEHYRQLAEREIRKPRRKPRS